MTTRAVARHQLQVPSTEGVDARIADTVAKELAGIEAGSPGFKRLLPALLRLMGWRCYLDPTANKAESWEATVMAMQAANAIFEIANADEGEVRILVGEQTVTVPAGSTRDIAHAGNWVTAYYLAVVCREQDRLKMLAETPIELLRASGAEFDEYIYAWVDTLQTYWHEGPDIGAKLQAALQGTDPETTGTSSELMLKILYPPINLFHRFLHNQRAEFNDALAEALELNKEYWDTPEEGRNYLPTGSLPLGPLAMTCFAYDAEFPVEVESDYLPKHLVQRSWLGEFPTVPRSASSAMIEDLSSPGGYGRFLEHLEGRLGGIKHVEGPEVSGSNRGYALICSNLADPGVATVTTNGVRFQQITSMLPEEFTCSMQEDQEHIARYLVDTVASLAISSGRGLEYEQVVRNEQPIIADTAMYGILASPSPYFGSEFDLYRNDNGQPSLQIITLIPVTAAEADFVEEADAEELYDVWRENRTNLLDVHRESAL